jgi:hypothetical protein
VGPLVIVSDPPKHQHPQSGTEIDFVSWAEKEERKKSAEFAGLTHLLLNRCGVLCACLRSTLLPSISFVDVRPCGQQPPAMVT